MSSLRDKILFWVNEERRGGASEEVAFVQVLDRIHREKLDRELLDTFGGELIAMIYHQSQRREPVSPDHRPSPVKVSKPARSDKPRAQPGPQRVDVSQLRRPVAYLNALVRVDGEWIALGDLHRRHCKALQVVYEAQQQAAQTKMAAFKQLAEQLREGERVRDQFDEDALRALFGDSLVTSEEMAA